MGKRHGNYLMHLAMGLLLGVTTLSAPAGQQDPGEERPKFGPRKGAVPANPHRFARPGEGETIPLPPPLLRRLPPLVPGYNDPKSVWRRQALEAWRSLPGYYPMRFGDPTKPQVCQRESMRPTTPTEDFIDHGDGTVTHIPTGLMWMRCSMGHTWDGSTCTGVILRSTWREALEATEEFNEKGGFAGYTDWRLPNIKELSSIVERACISPSANLEIFPKTENIYYWSSTPYSTTYFKKGGDKWFRQRYWGTNFYTGKNIPGYKTIRRSRLVREP